MVRDTETNRSDPRREIRILGADGKPTNAFPPSEADEWQAVFSPHTNWIAYTSNMSGTNEVYVRPFPFRSGATYAVSENGGSLPHWNPNGKELFYVSADQHLMAVTFDEKSHAMSKPVKLFQAAFERAGPIVYSYAVSQDGTRFLVRSTLREEPHPPATVVLNWMAGLKGSSL